MRAGWKDRISGVRRKLTWGFSNVGRFSSSPGQATFPEKLKREIKRIEVLERSKLHVLL